MFEVDFFLLINKFLRLHRIGYIEIYNEQIFDLLANSPADSSNQPLTVYDDRGDVFVKGLTYILANTEEDALNCLFEVS